MRTYLLLISLLFTFSSISAQTDSDSTSNSEYNVVMNARGNELTAICFMNETEDGSIIGTLVNEFGLKAFDFTFSAGKAKVLNVMGPLNRWYIRKVLNNDFTFILSNINRNKNVEWKRRTMTILPNGDIDVNNRRFKIHYTFSKTHIENNETDK